MILASSHDSRLLIMMFLPRWVSARSESAAESTACSSSGIFLFPFPNVRRDHLFQMLSAENALTLFLH